MPCPHLKEVVMLYCDAYHIKKMVPLDRLASANPGIAEEFHGCRGLPAGRWCDAAVGGG